MNGTINLYGDLNILSIEINDFVKSTGTIFYKDNRKYEGEINIKKLVPHGNGIVHFPVGSSKKYYDGEWYLGQMNGKGKLLYANKTQYDG